MSGIVTFNFAAWVAQFPEFAALTEPQAQGYFDQGGMYLDNFGGGPCIVPAQKTILMNLVTAHIAWLFAPRDANGNPAATGTPAPPIVGRISSASEGSVSLSIENQYPPGSVQWWQQTRYGSAYWAMTAAYRTMHYLPGTPRNMEPFFRGAPFGLRGFPFRR